MTYLCLTCNTQREQGCFAPACPGIPDMQVGLSLDETRALRAENTELRKDAERYQWLAAYLVSTNTEHDDPLVACASVAAMDSLIDALKGELK